MSYYFQTWTWASKINRKSKWFGALLRQACGKLTGHEASKTEWGYGGGGYADVWCRWCNQIGSIPLSKATDRFENFRSTVWGATGCDIKQQEWTPAPDAAGDSFKESK